MSDIPKETEASVLKELDCRAVLEYLNYRPDTIQETDKTVRCFCPVHKESVVRTLTIDKSNKKGKCLYTPCPARKSTNLISLVALTKGIEEDEALIELVQHFGLKVEVPGVEDMLEKRLDAASMDLAAGELEKALAGFKHVLSIQADNLTALEGMATVCEQMERDEELTAILKRLAALHHRQNNFQAAASVFEQFLQRNPKDIETRLRFAECLHRLDRKEAMLAEMFQVAKLFEETDEPEKALEIYHRIETLKPGSEDVTNSVIDLLVKVGRSDEAIEQIAEQASHMRESGDVDGAVSAYLQIVDIDPQKDQYRLEIVHTILAAPPEDDADETVKENRIRTCLEQVESLSLDDSGPVICEALEKLRERYPDNIALLEKLGKTYEYLGREEEANALRDSLAQTYVAKAGASAESGNMEESLAFYQKALELHPENIDALEGLLEVSEASGEDTEALAPMRRQLAELFAEAKEYEKAIPHLERFLQDQPDDMDMRLKLVECLHSVGRGSEMIGELKTVANSLVEKDKTSEAIGIYERIASIDPEDQEVQHLVVELMVKEGRVDEAAAHIAKQADRYRVEGDLDQALAAYRQVLDLDPNRDDIRLKYLQTLVAKPELKDEALQECLSLIDGFVQEEWSNMALQILEDLRARFPGNTIILEKIYQVYRSNDRENDADALAFDLAQNFMDAEDYESALQWVETLIERGGPGQAIAYTLKANICRAMGNTDQAVASLLEIINANEEADEYEEALPFYESVLEIDPENLDLQKRYLDSLAKQEMEEEFEEAANEILPLLSQHPEGNKALGILDDLIQRNPRNAEWKLAKSQVLRRMDREDDARKTMMQAADLLADQDENERAIEILEQLVEMDPHDLAVIEKLADYQLNLGDEDKALESYMSLANLYAQEGSLDAQLDVMLKISEVRPDDTDILKNILKLYEQLENTRDAKELREKMIRLYLAQKNWNDALQLCRDSLESDPGDIFALETSVRIYDTLEQMDELRDAAMRLLQSYMAADESEKANKVLDLLEDKFPDDRTILNLRLETECASGDWSRVMQTLDQLMDVNDRANEPEASLEAFRKILATPGAPVMNFVTAWMELLRETNRVKENWDQTEKMILHLEQEQHVSEAIDILEQVLESEPGLEPARGKLIDLLTSSGQNSRAVDALCNWSRICIADEKIEQANEHYNRALSLNPENLDLLMEVLGFRAARNIEDGTGDLAIRIADILERDGLLHQPILVLEMGLSAEPARSDIRARLLQLEDYLAYPTPLRQRYMDKLEEKIADAEFEIARNILTEAIFYYPMDLDLREKMVEVCENLDLKQNTLSELSYIAQIKAQEGDVTDGLKTLNRILEIDGENHKARAMETEFREELSSDEVAFQEFKKLAEQMGTSSPDKMVELLAAGGAPGEDNSLEMLPILKEYSFDNFVVGTRNNFAYATAMAVSKTPGGDYNPLFIYGDVGLGKTHLLHAIATELLRQRPETRVLYTSSEEFTNALIEAIQNNTIRQFRAIHKSPDIFLIDDIHGLAEKERAQEEFFQIFNSLYQANKQIVMTSDRPPKEIAHLERRLRSRFGAGIIVDIAPPDFETRIAILRHILEEAEANMDDEVVTLLAQTIESNIRELKSAVIQILARLKLTNAAPDSELVMQIVDQIREN
ncbi:MAG: DnaA ATPase domain-containing protein [Candidatus Sumerlaeia bacterium]